MLVPQNLCVWNLKLPDVGACVRWLATGMSTRLWTIQYRMVTRAFARWPSRGSQPIRSSIAEKHYWYSRLLPGLSPLCGPIDYSRMDHFFVFGASYAGGKHRLEHVCFLGVLTSLCHSNGHIETMPAREINPFTALTRIRSLFLRTQWSTSNHSEWTRLRLEHVDTTMYFYGEIRQCTCNWQWKLLLVWLTVSHVGDIHWRLVGDTQIS